MSRPVTWWSVGSTLGAVVDDRPEWISAETARAAREVLSLLRRDALRCGRTAIAASEIGVHRETLALALTDGWLR